MSAQRVGAGSPLFASGRQEWRTPRWLFRELDREFGFTRDVCASAENAQCDRYFTADDDGLLQPWAPDVCWMNPPYGRMIGAWVAKAYEESRHGATVVCLLPARTDTAWWHDWIEGRAECRFLRGRLSFSDPAGAPKRGHDAPFPSVVVIFRPNPRAGPQPDPKVGGKPLGESDAETYGI